MPVEDTLSDLTTFTTVLSVELDPMAPNRPTAAPGILSRTAALDLAEAVATDLRELAPELDQFGLVVPGALYDQTQLLRAGFPIVESLEAVFRGGAQNGYTPQLIALGVDDGKGFPVRVLNPEYPQDVLGPLLLMPLTFVGPAPAISGFGEKLEETLLHTGLVSSATRGLIEHHFGLEPVHLSYATLADLCALLSVQLENAGFTELWSLLEHAFFDRSEPLLVRLPEANLFAARGRLAYTPIYTLDVWQASTAPPDTETGLSTFLAWTRLQRQYEVTLQAYGMEIRHVLAMGPIGISEPEAVWNQLSHGAVLGGAWYCEEAAMADATERTRRLAITNQSVPDLGTVAYTVERYSDHALQSREHFYPLSPDGLQAISDYLASLNHGQGLERTVTHNERITIDPRTGLMIGANGRQANPEPAVAHH